MSVFESLGKGAEMRQQEQLRGQQIQQGQLAVQQQQKMMELMKQMPAGQTTNPADALDSLAGLAAQSGYVEMAGNLATKGAAIRKSQADAARKQQEIREHDLNTAASLLEGVTDQASWDRAMAMTEMMTGKRSPYADRPYSPELVKQLKDGIQSAKDKAATEASRALTEDRRAQVGLTKARTELARERAAALRKNGGTKIKDPELKGATDLIQRDYRGIGDEEARIFGRQITERAGELMRSNPALTKSQATARAYHEKRASGVFAPYAQAKPKTAKDKGYKMANGQPLTPGTVVDGYAWTGGDPNDPNSWESARDEEDE